MIGIYGTIEEEREEAQPNFIDKMESMLKDKFQDMKQRFQRKQAINKEISNTYDDVYFEEYKKAKEEIMKNKAMKKAWEHAEASEYWDILQK